MRFARSWMAVQITAQGHRMAPITEHLADGDQRGDRMATGDT
jgi:hypothetical protein